MGTQVLACIRNPFMSRFRSRRLNILFEKQTSEFFEGYESGGESDAAQHILTF